MNAPTDAEWNDLAVEFVVPRVHVKALDELLRNMADIDDMVDELDDAAKKANRDATAHRQAPGLQAQADRSYRRYATASIDRRADDRVPGVCPEARRVLARWQSNDTARAT
jgi:hypothetical protein